jgi:predicted nucleotidyltransferase
VNKKPVDDKYKERIKNHFCELDLLLDESYKNSNIRDKPSEITKIKAIELYKKLYFEDVRG